MPSRFNLTSFENSSILRKMSILYFVMSILPVSVLYYLYLELRDKGQIQITEQTFNLTLIFVVIGVGVGYIAMRSLIISIIDITKENRVLLEEIIGESKVKQLGSGSSNEVAILARSFNEITSRLEENVRNLELAKRTLHSVLAKIGEGISSMENIDNFLNLILETVTEALEARVGVLLLVDEKTKELYVKAVYGKDCDLRRIPRMDFRTSLFGPLFTSKQPAIIEKISAEGSIPVLFEAPMLCAPLVLHDDVLGVIAVCGRLSEEEFDEEVKGLLFNLALQTAVAIENSKLNEDAERTYFETISALALAVEAKDPYSRGHLDRVASLVSSLGMELKLEQKDINMLRDAAKLHDIGKIGVTDKVLTKEGPLTAQEMDMMKKHCEIGEGIIKPIRSLRMLCDIVRHHHEKLDGSGYPDGLKGDEVHPLVRILTVADIFDALTSNRPYRKSFSKAEAITELRRMKDKVDQKVVEALSRVV